MSMASSYFAAFGYCLYSLLVRLYGAPVGWNRLTYMYEPEAPYVFDLQLGSSFDLLFLLDIFDHFVDWYDVVDER